MLTAERVLTDDDDRKTETDRQTDGRESQLVVSIFTPGREIERDSPERITRENSR